MREAYYPEDGREALPSHIIKGTDHCTKYLVKKYEDGICWCPHCYDHEHTCHIVKYQKGTENNFDQVCDRCHRPFRVSDKRTQDIWHGRANGPRFTKRRK